MFLQNAVFQKSNFEMGSLILSSAHIQKINLYNDKVVFFLGGGGGEGEIVWGKVSEKYIKRFLGDYEIVSG